MTDEIKSQGQTPDLGEAKTPDLGQAGSIPNDDKIKTEVKSGPEKPITDFKIAEIWIRDGQLRLEAVPEFWKDKFRARGLIAYLDDIVREAKIPEDKPRIIPGNGGLNHKIMNFARGFRRRR